MVKENIRMATIFNSQFWHSERRYVFIGLCFGVIVVLSMMYFNSPNISGIKVPMMPFPEPAWRTPNTLKVTTLASTPFARFEIHQVRTENGEIINDWLWTDERSHVNILVHLKEENKFLLFRQKKYGLEREYYALIGGLFNIGESGIDCARRELLEETGLEAEELVSLGQYRVQVNRGGGILHAYLAKNCVISKMRKKSDDYEKQTNIKFDLKELITAALTGEIGEAQWVATAALGILYMQNPIKTTS